MKTFLVRTNHGSYSGDEFLENALNIADDFNPFKIIRLT